MIHRASGGIPRRINALCDRLLLLGFLGELTLFSPKEVEEVAAELNDKPFGISEVGLMAPTAIDGSMAGSMEAELDKLALDLDLDGTANDDAGRRDCRRVAPDDFSCTQCAEMRSC